MNHDFVCEEVNQSSKVFLERKLGMIYEKEEVEASLGGSFFRLPSFLCSPRNECTEKTQETKRKKHEFLQKTLTAKIFE
jgi:hypothetical protein